MTEKDVNSYLRLVERRLFIVTHSGIGWRPEYGPELECIDREIADMRLIIEREHAKRDSLKKSIGCL